MPETTIREADHTALLARESEHASGKFINYATIDLTTAELLALNTTQKVLVAAPGAGKFLEFISAFLIYTNGGTDYATQGDLTVRQTDDSGTALSDTVAGADLLLNAASVTRLVQALSADVALLTNVPLVLSVATADPTAGDGSLKVKIAYRVHDSNV